MWFRWFLRHRWLWCRRCTPIMGLAVWGTLPKVLLSSGQMAGYYNTVASSMAFTHLQNNSFFNIFLLISIVTMHHLSQFSLNVWIFGVFSWLLCVIPACSMLVICSEGVIQCFFMVELENIVCVFPLWSIRELHSKTLQRKTFRCHFILQTQKRKTVQICTRSCMVPDPWKMLLFSTVQWVRLNFFLIFNNSE